MERKCGDCSLCCKLVPVKSIGKPGYTRCRFQRHKGCLIHDTPNYPGDCAVWACRWLLNAAGETSRPDRTHIVIDIMPDYVTVILPNGEPQQIEAVQCWVDPKYPEAHEDKDFRDFVETLAMDGVLCLLRYPDGVAKMLFAPSMMPDNKFYLREDGMTKEEQHTPQQLAEVLEEIRMEDDE